MCSMRRGSVAAAGPLRVIRGRSARAALALPRLDRPLELGLPHRRAALDAELAGLGVELVLRAALGPIRSRAEASAPAGGDVPGRRLRRGLRLAVAGALL